MPLIPLWTTSWLGLLWLAGIVSLYRIELSPSGGRPRRFSLSLLAYVLLVALILVATARPILSSAAALAALVLTGAASRTKMRLVADNLVFDDIRYAFTAGGLPFLAGTYPRLAAKAALALAGAAAAVAAVAIGAPDFREPRTAASFVAVAVMALIALDVRRRDPAHLLWLFSAGNHLGYYRGHFIGFTASIVTAFVKLLLPFSMDDVAQEAGPLPAVTATPPARLPHVILIHHESTFDPGLYGLPVTEAIERFLRPPGSLNGLLAVDVFGGHSWMTEFSIQTGLSARCFGANGNYIFQSGRGRFARSLASRLRDCGYATLIAATMKGRFLNYANFYRSIGFEHTLFLDEMPETPRTVELKTSQSDPSFYAAILDHLAAAKRTSGPPLFAALITNFNHGPHDKATMPSECCAEARDFARRALPDEAYAEYFARLEISAVALDVLKARLFALYPGEPVLFIRYGDHQPAFVGDCARFTDDADFAAKSHQTFYSIEAHGFELGPAERSDPLDSAFLGTVALEAAGLAGDPLHALHIALVAECGGAYFTTQSAAKARYHRHLIDAGLVVAAPHPPRP